MKNVVMLKIIVKVSKVNNEKIAIIFRFICIKKGIIMKTKEKPLGSRK